MPSDLVELAGALTALGCPADRSIDMAGQLDRRAHQLSEKTGRTHDEALTHLLRLMAGGWAARGTDAPPDPAP